MGEIVRAIGATIEAIDEATNVFQRVEFSDRVRVDTFFPVTVPCFFSFPFLSSITPPLDCCDNGGSLFISPLLSLF